ncbi:heme-binding protein [Mycobacterium sp. HUMS_1102779]|uniref:heme-binding protein n=1 Tax=Mycobacterium sp. HUMS_1102779 TaxID=3383487 RepID=UPI003899D161
MNIRRLATYRPLAGAAACCLLAGVVSAPAAAAPRVTTAYLRPHEQAAVSLHDYVRTHPQQYNDLRGIMMPVVARNPQRPSAAPGQRRDAGGFQVVQQVLRVGEDG